MIPPLPKGSSKYFKINNSIWLPVCWSGKALGQETFGSPKSVLSSWPASGEGFSQSFHGRELNLESYEFPTQMNICEVCKKSRSLKSLGKQCGSTFILCVYGRHTRFFLSYFMYLLLVMGEKKPDFIRRKAVFSQIHFKCQQVSLA